MSEHGLATKQEGGLRLVLADERGFKLVKRKLEVELKRALPVLMSATAVCVAEQSIVLLVVVSRAKLVQVVSI